MQSLRPSLRSFDRTTGPSGSEENAAAADVLLTADERKELGSIAPRDVAAGTRYLEATMRAVDG